MNQETSIVSGNENIIFICICVIMFCFKTRTLIIADHINTCIIKNIIKKYINHSCGMGTSLHVASNYDICNDPIYADIVWDRIVYFKYNSDKINKYLDISDTESIINII